MQTEPAPCCHEFQALSGHGPIKAAVPLDVAQLSQPLAGPSQLCQKLAPHSPCKQDKVDEVEVLVRKLPRIQFVLLYWI